MKAFLGNMDEIVKQTMDGISVGTIVATFLGFLPHIATLLSIVWMIIRIAETETVRRLLGKEPLK